ncbi:MAG TPA: cytochrome b5-like heme/steroid binding domain-containing protein, partial [Kineosporiaceae bacterium]|nr:cytochrome b5-like heme/steroid binding domain-containing protein [Kineosporiaceae bacterium]
MSRHVLTVSQGLPFHPLVVHAVTVLLPLSVLGLVVAVLLPRFRARVAGLSVLGLAVAAASAWFAEESGESLADRVGVAQAHARYGAWVPVVAVLALIVGVVWWRLQRGPAIPGVPAWSTRAAGIAVVVTAVVTVGVTVLAGHSGAVSVWESKGQTGAAAAMSSAPAVGTTAGVTPGATPGAQGGHTLAEVARHNTRESCWSVVEGTVYDLTPWISKHPGGPGTIAGMCGVDATGAFRGKHGAAPAPAGALTGFAIGPLSAGGPASGSASPATAPTAAPAPTTRYSQAEVAKHASPSDCWSVVNGKVYDLTQWVSRHPGGQGAIAEMCGT